MSVDICCIGHLTIDKVITPEDTVYMPGGTSFYFSNAIANMDVLYLLVTAVAESEAYAVEALEEKGITIRRCPTRQTVFFENKYGNNPNERTQRVLQEADPFLLNQFADIEAKIFHIGPLLANDISAESIIALSAKGKISLDVQGFLRKVEGKCVHAIDWKEKNEVLPHLTYLKVNEEELHVITGHVDIPTGAKQLVDCGVTEVVVTLGSKGSVVYTGDKHYTIPAFPPDHARDATGCGDTYMAGYLYMRCKGASIQESGQFAAAMATLKIGNSGPFTGTKEDVYALLKKEEKASLKQGI